MTGFRRHPTRRSLLDWLQGERDDPIDRHLETCERCATTLELLDAETADQAIGEALAAALAPPGGFIERLETNVTARLDSRVVFGVMGDLFAAGFETTRLLAFGASESDDLP